MALHLILSEEKLPTFVDAEQLPDGYGGKRWKLCAGKKEDGYTGSVEVTVT